MYHRCETEENLCNSRKFEVVPTKTPVRKQSTKLCCFGGVDNSSAEPQPPKTRKMRASDEGFKDQVLCTRYVIFEIVS